MKVLNQTGMKYIEEALNSYHKKPELQNIEAWANDVERHIQDGNGAYFEIPSRHSISGAPIVVNVADEFLMEI